MRLVKSARTTVRFLLENTGDAVDPLEGDRWFDPFMSTTAEVDPILGQGMGLGLTITRWITESYGGEVQFVKPSRGFATALEVVCPPDEQDVESPQRPYR